jgi:hypothetical protein
MKDGTATFGGFLAELWDSHFLADEGRDSHFLPALSFWLMKDGTATFCPLFLPALKNVAVPVYLPGKLAVLNSCTACGR